MKLIEKESDLEGLVLRPLSAKLLEPTFTERKGLVNRERLLAIRGQRRLTQIKLAGKYGVKDYPCPAGGCRLTNPVFAKKVKEAFEHNESSLDDLHLLRYGRRFRLPSGAKVVVGRNEKENKVILKLVKEDDLLFEVKGYGSLIVLLRKKKR